MEHPGTGRQPRPKKCGGLSDSTLAFPNAPALALSSLVRKLVDATYKSVALAPFKILSIKRKPEI